MTTTKYIEIRDSAGKPVAFLSPQADGLKADTAYINNELNSNCSLIFELPATSEKWAYITDAYEFLVDGKRFILLKPDTEEVVRDGKKVWGKVTAQEKWVEMDKQYVTVSNDPDFPTPDWSVVRIGNGTPAGGYPAGSAGSALTYLLAGSGWTLLTCDVTGSFELITEKISRLANIQKVQELWGGNLFWDSENKTVSLRDEALYQNYTGFQVRYAKNLKGITKNINRDLVTRLYPFGYEDLSIGGVNGGVIYLDNFTHTSKVYEGQWVNQDITDATELKTKAITELAKLCKPRYTYKITMLDLSVKPQWAHETFSMGDMADVIDLDVGANDRLRIIRHKYNIFQRWKCEVDVGEPLEKLASRIADTSAVTEKVLANTGTSNIFKGIINTAATAINGASGDYSCIDGVSTWYGSLGGVRDGKVTRITPNGLIISDDGAQTWRAAIDIGGAYADKVVCSDLYALGSGDGYTKLVGSGLKVFDASDVVQVHVGQYETGKFGIKALNGVFEGLKSKWDLGAGTFRLGTSDADYELLFDGTDLLFSDDVKIQFKGDTGATGATGATGPQGPEGPNWSYLTSTKITSTTIESPIITGNAGRFSDCVIVGPDATTNNLAGINGADTGGTAVRFWAGATYANRATAPFRVTQAGKLVAEDATINGDFKVYGGSTMVGQFYKDTNGGIFNIYDIDGKINVKIGSEGTGGNNVGGTLALYNDSVSSKRVALGIASDDYGQIQVLNSSGIATAVLSAAYNGTYQYGSVALFNSGGTSQTMIRAAAGSYFLNSLGIGTSSPLSTVKLHVEGQSKLNGNVGIGASPHAPTSYSSTSAYAVDDLVSYSGSTYKCTTAIALPGEAWTVSHWELLVTTYVNGNVGIGTNPVVNYSLIANLGIKAAGFATSVGVGVSGTFTNPTSITVSGGIITAIS